MRAFRVFAKNYLRPCAFSGANFTTTNNCRNSKTEIQSEIMKKNNHWNTSLVCNKTNISPLLAADFFVSS